MFVTEAGTDIAMLGVWDADAPTDDIAKKGGKAFQTALDTDSRDGKLIYVHTYEDGSYSMGVVVGEDQLPAETQAWYSPVDRQLFLDVPSGRILVGGLEDYRSSDPQITSESDVFEVGPGIYSVLAYQLTDDEERITEEVQRQVGVDEYEYFRTRSTGCLGAFLLLLAGLTTSLLWSWWAMAIAVGCSIAFAAYVTKVNSRDDRYMAVKKAFDDWFLKHPVILLVFQESVELQRSDGFFDLDYESA